MFPGSFWTWVDVFSSIDNPYVNVLVKYMIFGIRSSEQAPNLGSGCKGVTLTRTQLKKINNTQGQS